MKYKNKNQNQLYELGRSLVIQFCDENKITTPTFRQVPKTEWWVGACAYYRPDEKPFTDYNLNGINICTDLCKQPCGEILSRNWSWPGHWVDQTPVGVIAHELGHHVDRWVGFVKNPYHSEFSSNIRKKSGELPITNYEKHLNHEWFAEMFRLYVTNPELLLSYRPKTYRLLDGWFASPNRNKGWRKCLGADCPKRIIAIIQRRTELT